MSLIMASIGFFIATVTAKYAKIDFFDALSVLTWTFVCIVWEKVSKNE
jgi:hypothetical protein